MLYALILAYVLSVLVQWTLTYTDSMGPGFVRILSPVYTGPPTGSGLESGLSSDHVMQVDRVIWIVIYV